MKFEFKKEIIATIKTRIPSIPNIEVDHKLRGVLWKKTESNTILLITESYDETVFIDQYGNPFDTEKVLILKDMYTYIENLYMHLDKEIDIAITTFELASSKAVYVQLYDVWIDLIIRRDYFGILPPNPIKVRNLLVRQLVNVKTPAVSDEKMFTNKEDIKNTEKLAVQGVR